MSESSKYWVTGWQRAGWVRAIGPDGELWCESSDYDEVVRMARPGDRIELLWANTEYEWREVLA